MWEHYIQKKESMHKIARGLRCDHTLVDYWMKKFQIPKRSCSEAQRLRQSNHVTLTKELLELLNGMLLGDGHLARQEKGWSPKLWRPCKHEEYLVWLSAKLFQLGVEQGGKINKYTRLMQLPGNKHSKFYTSFLYSSRSYLELVKLHDLWYRKARKEEKFKTGKQKKYIKILPGNLQLTSLTCLMWYLGDGTLCKRWGYLNFATQCFTTDEIDFLIGLLMELRFKASRNKNKDIQMSVKSSKDFFDYIGPCPEKIEGVYGYRWKSYGT